MLIGVPKEIKNHEYRVGLTPASVMELVSHGHKVIVETNAGSGIYADDEAYRAAGASIVDTAEEIFATAEMVVKVKEPQPQECKQLREGQVLFTYLHLAPDLQQTELLLESGVTAIAYETVVDRNGGLPLLAPMSEVAGRLAAQAGAHYLEKPQQGLGKLIGGVTGVAPAKVLVIGGGMVGENAAWVASGMGADVTVLDKSIDRLRQLDDKYQGRVNNLYSTQSALQEHVLEADLVIGAVLIPGAAAPKLLTRNMISDMKPNSVVVDVAIDQGGCFETSKATTHAEPIYIVDDVTHYCVANMPGAVPTTSSFALNNATLPYTIKLANMGWKAALASDSGFALGLNVHQGKLTNSPVAEAHDMESIEPSSLL